MIKIAHKLAHTARSAAGSHLSALFTLTALALLFSGHQEVLAKNAPYDEYYFLLRSSSFDLMGSRLAPIKEYLYSFFIDISQVFGLNLRNFEVICYGIALAWLWGELRKLTRSAAVAWLTVVPLAFFTYQSPVFNLTTYDALQLILTPLTFASAAMILRRNGSFGSLTFAGLVAGLQVLTRPEGVLFLAAPLVSLMFVAVKTELQNQRRVRFWRLLSMAFVVCAIPFVIQEGMCAVNEVRFGFWAPTIMKSGDFTGALTALMSIRPTNNSGGRYAPVPISAMEQAFQVSPAFRKAKPYFSANLGGTGWSAWAPKGYETHDGSIDGGHFEWALLEASAYVAGPESKAMLGYLGAVTKQLDAAFQAGKLQRRIVISTSVGPNFSPINKHFWYSIWKIGKILLDYGPPVLPQVGYVASKPEVERDFNLLALRRAALVQSDDRQLVGWLVDPSKGLPNNIFLSEPALASGATLKLIERPDVAGIIAGLSSAQAEHPLVGFQLSVPGASGGAAGSIEVRYGDVITHVPLAKLAATNQGAGFSQDGIRVQVDRVITPPNIAQSKEFVATWWISFVAYYVMRVAFVLSAILFVIAMLIGVRSGDERRATTNLCLIAAIAASILLPRVLLFAAVDSFMFPGTQPRYLAVAEFSMWFFAVFVIAQTGHCAYSSAVAPLRRRLLSGMYHRSVLECDADGAKLDTTA